MSAGKDDVQEREPIFLARRDSRLTLNESLSKLLTTYLQYHSIEGSTESTIKHKRKEIAQFLRFLEAQGHSMTPGDVTLFDVIGHLEDMKLRGLAVASIHTRRRALHAWFAWMVDWEILEVNPVTKVKVSPPSQAAQALPRRIVFPQAARSLPAQHKDRQSAGVDALGAVHHRDAPAGTVASGT